MNEEFILDLIPYNESGLVLYESSFEDIIDRIKAWFHKLLVKIREFFAKLTNTSTVAVKSNSKWVEENKEKIKKGYDLFKQAGSTINGKDVFYITNLFEKEIDKISNSKYKDRNYIDKLENDLTALITSYKANEKEFPNSELLSINPEEEYESIGSNLSGAILHSHTVEYHNIANGLNSAIDDLIKNNFRGLEEESVDNLIRYASSDFKEINDGYKSTIKYLENQLSIISSIGSKYKRDISLFNPSYRSQANKILDRVRVLINDYTSIVTSIYNIFLKYAKASRNGAMSILKLYASFDDKEVINPKEEYDMNGVLKESSNIFESVKFI